MPSVAEKIVGAFTPKSARTKIEAAHQAAVVDHQAALGNRQRAAYQATLDPAAKSALDAANSALADAEHQLQVTTEALAELGVVEAKDAQTRTLAAEKAVDAKARAACHNAVAVAKEHQAAIAAYVETYRKLVAAAHEAEAALVSTPRSRPDLRRILTDVLVPDELARASKADAFGNGLVPGSNAAHALTSGTTADWPSLAQEIEARVNAACVNLRT